MPSLLTLEKATIGDPVVKKLRLCRQFIGVTFEVEEVENCLFISTSFIRCTFKDLKECIFVHCIFEDCEILEKVSINVHSL